MELGKEKEREASAFPNKTMMPSPIVLFFMVLANVVLAASKKKEKQDMMEIARQRRIFQSLSSVTV